ncbi:MAG: O-antigen ligase family protein [Chitinivibrionia bacterium]|nr:O-antigen ligase family protein [Chitinivibrionia bacterium]
MNVNLEIKKISFFEKFAFFLSKIDIKFVFFIMIFIGPFFYVDENELSFLPPHFYISITLEFFLLFIAISMTALAFVNRKFNIPVNKLIIIMFSYIFICLISIILNMDDKLNEGLIEYSFLTYNFIWFLLMIYMLKNNGHKVLIYAIITLAFFNSIISYMDFIFDFGDKSGLFGDRNFYGRLLVVVAAYLIIRLFNADSLLKKILLLFGILLLSVNITILFGRGAYLAYLFAIFAIIIATKSKKIIVCGILLCCIVALLFAYMTVKRVKSQRMNVVNMSDAGRISAMYAGFNMWKAKPILGVGYGTARFRTREYENISVFGFNNQNMAIHNIYVQQLAETGLIGFLLYNIFNVMLLSALARKFKGKKNLVKERPYELFYAIALCVYLITGMFYPIISEGYIWYFSAGAIILLGNNDNNTDSLGT